MASNRSIPIREAGQDSLRCDFAAIPNELKALPRWVCWRGVIRDDKLTRIPLSATTGNLASSTDAKTWCTYKQALSFLKRGKADGIGFVFAPPYSGIDLDDCRNAKTGKVESRMMEIIKRFGSYTEISPSGTGVHIIVKGSLPKGRRKKGPIEMYDSGRYFTMTGRPIDGTPRTIEERQEELRSFHAEIFGQGQPSKTPIDATPSPANSVADSLADDEIITAARRLPKFARLWDGDWNGYPSHSEADLALCLMLADWTERDPDRIDRLFRKSKLLRPKWDERRGNLTYGELTIATAIKQSSLDGNRPEISGNGLVVRNSDLGNAQRLVARHGRNLRFCFASGKFLIWDGSRWASDLTGEVDRLAKSTIQSLYSEASDLADSAARAELAKHALNSEAERRIRAMVELAKTERGVPVTPEQLDANPWLLNCSNGTIDLRTGLLLPAERGNLCTKLVPVAFDSDAACPTWNSFLTRIMAGDLALISFLQRAIGYSLTGMTTEQVLLVLYGTGANGKTTFIEAIRKLLGDYAQQADFTSFLERRGDGARNDLARLNGARFVAAVEASENQKLAEAIVKQVTGGDTITARFLYHEFFEFPPQFKLFLVTNHKPRIAGTDEAIWRRIRLVPFNVTIPKDERDKQLPEKLQRELPGIFAWAVRGCLDWQRDGLGEPEQVSQATAEYRREMDLLGDFLDEQCVIGEKEIVSASDLYAALQSWCQTNGEEVMTQQKFGTTLRERGFKPAKKRGRRSWSGLRLRCEDDDY